MRRSQKNICAVQNGQLVNSEERAEHLIYIHHSPISRMRWIHKFTPGQRFIVIDSDIALTPGTRLVSECEEY